MPTATVDSGQPPTGFVDAATGFVFERCHPFVHRALWTAYLDGAEQEYRLHGVEQALGREAIEDGRETSLFWVARSGDGEIVGGLRVNGPVASTAEVHAMRELHGHPSLPLVAAQIRQRIPLGVIEVKGVWTRSSLSQRRFVSSALARCYVHSLDQIGVRYALCTASDHAVRQWETSGGRAVPGLTPVPYPDERYRTVLLWWDRHEIARTATAEQQANIWAETTQLRGRRTDDTTGVTIEEMSA